MSRPNASSWPKSLWLWAVLVALLCGSCNLADVIEPDRANPPDRIEYVRYYTDKDVSTYSYNVAHVEQTQNGNLWVWINRLNTSTYAQDYVFLRLDPSRDNEVIEERVFFLFDGESSIGFFNEKLVFTNTENLVSVYDASKDEILTTSVSVTAGKQAILRGSRLYLSQRKDCQLADTVSRRLASPAITVLESFYDCRLGIEVFDLKDFVQLNYLERPIKYAIQSLTNDTILDNQIIAVGPEGQVLIKERELYDNNFTYLCQNLSGRCDSVGQVLEGFQQLPLNRLTLLDSNLNQIWQTGAYVGKTRPILLGDRAFLKNKVEDTTGMGLFLYEGYSVAVSPWLETDRLQDVLLPIDGNGQFLVSQVLPFSDVEFAQAKAHMGQLLLATFADDQTGLGNSIYLYRLDQNGRVLNTIEFPFGNYAKGGNRVSHILPQADGSIILVGEVFHSTFQNRDIIGVPFTDYVSQMFVLKLLPGVFL